MRSALAEVPLVCTIDIEGHVLEHQKIHSRLIKADPQGTEEASTHHAHITRLLDVLSSIDNELSNVNMKRSYLSLSKKINLRVV